MNIEKKILSISNYAYETVLLYGNIKENITLPIKNMEEFFKLPIVKKCSYLEDYESGISRNYFIDYLNNKLTIASTSGSDGRCLDVFWSDADYNKSMLPLWIIRKKRYNISTTDKECFFYTVPNDCEEFCENEINYQKSKNTLGFSKLNLDSKKFVYIFSMMQEFQPRWMSLQPSMAMLLANAIQKNNLKTINSLKYIEFTGEVLTKYEKNFFKKFFNCEIANQYGCNEMNSIAYECTEGNLHCMSSNVYVEILNNGNKVDENVEGEIYLTSLNNRVMPFIRYEIGDRGRLIKKHSCKCGNCSPILELTSARKNDNIHLSDNTIISAYVFQNIVIKINRKYKCINQFQIVQENYDYFIVKIVLDKEFLNTFGNYKLFEKIFIDNIEEEKIKNVNFNFEYFDFILPNCNTGKLKYFVCNI